MTITLSGLNNGASVVPLPVPAGGTGSTTSTDARTALGLGNISNTSDADKPISTAQQTALNLKANLVSPTLVTPVLGVATGTSFNSLTGLSSTTPVVAGTAAIGAATTAARADHVHPLQPIGSLTLAELNTAVSDADVQQALVSGTSIKTVNSTTLLGSGNILIDAAAVGLGNVSNTSDATERAATATLTNKTLTNPIVTNYVETVNAPAAGAAFTVDLTTGTIQKFTTNANTTITLPTSIAGKSYLVIVVYGGVHTITWAGGSVLKWAGGTAPTATSVNAKIDMFAFTCDGTNTYGRSGGSNF